MVLRFRNRALYNPVIVDSRISVRKTNTTTTRDAVEDPQDGGGSS
jgi:hypothetical protein